MHCFGAVIWGACAYGCPALRLPWHDLLCQVQGENLPLHQPTGCFACHPDQLRTHPAGLAWLIAVRPSAFPCPYS